MKNRRLIKGLAERISDAVNLIYLSEINLEVCKQIQKFVMVENRGVVTQRISFLVLVSSNAFFSTVGTLHTLLCSTKQNDIRLKPLLEEKIKNEHDIIYGTEEKEKADKLYNILFQDYPNINYSKYGFLEQGKKLGDQLSSLRKIKRREGILQLMKDAKKTFEENGFHKIRHHIIGHKNIYLKQVGGAEHYLIKEKYIEELDKTIKAMMLIVNFGFDYSLENPKKGVLIGLKRSLINHGRNN